MMLGAVAPAPRCRGRRGPGPHDQDRDVEARQARRPRHVYPPSHGCSSLHLQKKYMYEQLVSR